MRGGKSAFAAIGFALSAIAVFAGHPHIAFNISAFFFGFFGAEAVFG
jgi:hypothetical protein